MPTLVLLVQPFHGLLVGNTNTDVCLVCPQSQDLQPAILANRSKGCLERGSVRPGPIACELTVVEVALEDDQCALLKVVSTTPSQNDTTAYFAIPDPCQPWCLLVQPFHGFLVGNTNTDVCLVCPQSQDLQPAILANRSKGCLERCSVRPGPIACELTVVEVALEDDQCALLKVAIEVGSLSREIMERACGRPKRVVSNTAVPFFSRLRVRIAC